MREEDGSHSVFKQLFIRIVVNYTDFDEMLKNDFFCKQMHIFPMDSRFNMSFYCILSL